MATSLGSSGSITGPLIVGSRGNDVRTVQSLLNRVLTPSPGLTEDGIFGLKTDAAVRAFQQRNGLVADGIVGPKTAQALGLSFLRRVQPAVKPDPPGSPQPGGDVPPQVFLLQMIAQNVKRIVASIDAKFDNGFDDMEEAVRRARKLLKVAKEHSLFILSTAAAPGIQADLVANLTNLSLMSLVGGLGPVAAEITKAGGDASEIFSIMAELAGVTPRVVDTVRSTLKGQLDGGIRAGRRLIQEILEPLT